MPATIQTEYTDPTTGETAQVSLRVDVVKYRADVLPDGSPNTTLEESVMLQLQGPSGTDPYLRFMDGHVLDALLGVEDGASAVIGGASGNGGTPVDAKGLEGVCGMIAQLERPAIPTNATAVYTADMAATQGIVQVGTPASPDEASIAGTFVGTSNTVWTVEIVTPGIYGVFTAKVSSPTGDGDILAAQTFTDGVAVTNLNSEGIDLQFDDAGASSMTSGDQWTITLTAALAEGVLVTWTDSPDVVATFYKVVALSGAAWETEAVVDENDTGVAGTLVAAGAEQLNITSLNATPDDYKFAVYATSADADTDLVGTYNQSQRSTPSNTVTVV